MSYTYYGFQCRVSVNFHHIYIINPTDSIKSKPIQKGFWDQTTLWGSDTELIAGCFLFSHSS